ncbi:hypothetical protein CARUB_v10018523mg [Capsella rubella]|uniref:DUF7610 domain-containing protein n=1 Tax=Capsella rubella TaxID=81985 RepID=R0HJ27_9BRAS|nr:uncharacterized protein LOC17887432 [Capsella rubella]EOA25210.1 hypothetical protein CARUB_v10018523mg [Capsella rubella]
MKAKINTVLEKKLEELESLLEVVTFEDDDPNLRKLQLGVLFASTLLTAEISSRRFDVEGEEWLHCVAKRLTEMEAFIIKKWPGHHDSGLMIEPELESLESYAEGETGLDLVGSCLNESSKAEEEDEKEEEEKEEEVEAETEKCPLFQDASSEEMSEVKFPVVDTVKEEVVDREVKGYGLVCSRALVYFGLIGLVGGIMMSLVGYIGDSMKDDVFFLTPT